MAIRRDFIARLKRSCIYHFKTNKILIFLKETDTMKSATILTFYLVYIWQLLLFCSISDNLNHLVSIKHTSKIINDELILLIQSTCLGGGAYESLWCNKKYTDIRRCLVLVMLRSQRPVSMNAFGVFELNYVSFVAVSLFRVSLRFCSG